MREPLIQEVSPPRSLSDIPLIVITAGEYRDYKNIHYNNDEVNRVKQDIPIELFKLSQNSRHIFTKHSGHNIMYDQPELIINSIENMINYLK